MSDSESMLPLIQALLSVSPRLRIEDDQGVGMNSTVSAFRLGLERLAERERGGIHAATQKLQSLDALMRILSTTVESSELTIVVEKLRSESLGVGQIESATTRALLMTESALLSGEQVLSNFQLKELCDWEVREIASDLPADRTARRAAEFPINQLLLEEYLQRHLDDPSIAVSDCRRLPGGFGKETYLFAAVGAAISGDFVLRRDPLVNLFPYACRRVVKEYEVLKALQEQGFPSPEALWLDTQHPSIPGGDFIVMRRSLGISGGTLFGATQRPEPELSGRLGAMIGQLHALPPLYGLGSLTESIRPELWTMPVSEVVRKCLVDFRTLLIESRHSASPATVAIFNWLIRNVPNDDAQPCLVHGDIGFHNILLDQGTLTTLLDWERAHIGHPGEDLAYLYNAAGKDLDWGRLMDRYCSAGGKELSQIDLLYFRIMTQACNAVTTNIPAARMLSGETTDIRMLAVKYQMRPQILKFLGELIGSYPTSRSTQRKHE